MKKALVLSLAAVLAVLWCWPASAQYKATMRLASATAPDHPYNVGAQKFADLIKERTKDRISRVCHDTMGMGIKEKKGSEIE